MIQRTIFALAIFLLAAGVFFAWSRNREGYGLDDLIAGRPPSQAEKYTPPDAPALKPEDVPLLEKLNAENTRLIEAVTPAVVSVNTTRIVHGRALTLDWFGPVMRNRSIAQTGLGSGVIVTKEGHVVTNYHVVEGVDEIQVTTFDNTKSLATKIGEDPDADIAILKIQNPKVKEYPALSFADSDKVKVGEAVWAIGNPFGLSESVTQGIISHRDRQFSDRDPSKFQTDAVINPGNSGGPLVNTRGEIVGINVAIFTGQQNVQVWQGVGFAIPAKDVRRAFRRIMQIGAPGGREPVGYIGVSADTAAGDSDADTAVIITEVSPDSPADQAGVKPGDRVKKFGGRGVSDAMDFLKRINNYPVSEEADLVVSRGSETLNLKVTVVDREVAMSAEERTAERRDLRELIGIEVQNLTGSSRTRRNLAADFTGVVVSGVETGSPADGAMLRGDVIYQVNGIPVDSVEKFFSVIGPLRGRTFPMKIVRKGYSYTLNISL
ncbi:MAG: trypsin-like peptidase domain-containing protein [Verrucomicrobiales bacterium]